MKWITHIIFAILFVKLMELALSSNLLVDYFSWFILTVYAILPDFDSFLGIKHRTWTHSLVGLVVTVIPLLLSYELFLIAFLSYFSHLFADMLTVSGVPLLYPMKTKFYLLPPQFRIRTNSTQELAVICLIGLMGVVTFVTPNSPDVFKLLNDFDVCVDISYYEDGVKYECRNVRVVWSDGESKIGIIRSHRLKVIDIRSMDDFRVVDVKRVDRFVDRMRVPVKRLKTMDHLILGYDINGRYHEFLGSGSDLFDRLEGFEGKVTVYVVKSRCVD